MMYRRFPSLKAIRTFEVAARTLSFTKAAAELYVTPSAVSRMIQSLEEELGVALFHRIGRLLVLTPEGSCYFAEIAEALNRIAVATHALKSTAGSHILRISVLPTFALRWLVPRLYRFQEQYPDILVDIVSSEHLVDFDAEPVDIGIRYGLGCWSRVESTLLFNEDMGVFCSPDLIQDERRWTCPEDVLHQRLLQHTTRPHSWVEYFDAYGLHDVRLNVVGNFEHFFMTIEAAVAGMGIALLPLFLVQEEVVSGRLVQPFPQTLRKKQAYYFVHGLNAAKLSKVRVFKEWLLDEIAAL